MRTRLDALSRLVLLAWVRYSNLRLKLETLWNYSCCSYYLGISLERLKKTEIISGKPEGWPKFVHRTF